MGMQLPFHPSTHLLDQLRTYLTNYRELPPLNREMPPLFLYLEILRYLHSQISHKAINVTIPVTLMESSSETLGTNELSQEEVRFWLSNLFPQGISYIQRKSKILYDLVTHYHPTQELDLSLLRQYTNIQIRAACR